MKVQNKIREDMVSAMKLRDTETVSLLRVVSGEFGRVGKDLSDEQSIKVIRKMVENAKELGNLKEVEILDKYLPKMYSEDQTRSLVANIIDAHGYKTMKDISGVMKALNNNPGTALIDKKYASTYAKELLS